MERSRLDDINLGIKIQDVEQVRDQVEGNLEELGDRVE